MSGSERVQAAAPGDYDDTLEAQNDEDYGDDGTGGVEDMEPIETVGLADPDEYGDGYGDEVEDAVAMKDGVVLMDPDKMGPSGNVDKLDTTQWRDLKKHFAASRKFAINLMQNPSSEDPLPPEIVFINGYEFIIARGRVVRVPEEVYLVLVQAGRIQPMRPKDEKHQLKNFSELDRRLAQMRRGLHAVTA